MAHNITQINGVDQFYSLREPAWHRLGHVSDEALTFDEAYKKADMESTYYKSPLTTSIVTSDGVTTVEIPDLHAAMRHHHSSGQHFPLGVVGDTYKFHHPRDVFNWVNVLVDGGAVIETLGDLGGGKKMFLTIKLPTGITIGGTDRSDMYVFASTAFDGTQATKVRMTAVRVVCANTWAAADRDVKSAGRKTVSVRHTSDLTGNIGKARDLLTIGFEMSQELTALGDELLSITMRPEDQVDVIRTIVPIDERLLRTAPDKLSRGEKKSLTMSMEKRAAIWRLLETSPTLEAVQRPTAWGLFNAITEYVDHFAPVKGVDRDARRAERQLLGEAESMKQQSLSLLLV